MSNPQWRGNLLRYVKPDMTICITQILTTFIPYFVLMLAMVIMVKKAVPYWIVILFCPIAALFLVRMFIILHDCVHRSYLNRSSLACSILGHICGVFTFTAFLDFKQNHLIHHATVGNLEKQGFGDIWTMTVEGYRASPFWWRLVYRIFRNPIFLFGIAPTLKFVVMHRTWRPTSGKKEFRSIIFTDIMIGLIIAVAFFTIGIERYIIIQLSVIAIAASIGVWIFFIHHNFEGVYWAHDKDWDAFKAAMHGSVFYKLPAFLRWFTGSIGYHYVHHLNPGIPNYRLVECFEGIPELQEKRPVTLWQGFKSVRLALWNDETRKLEGFSVLKSIKNAL